MNLCLDKIVISKQNLVSIINYGCITMRQHVVCILNLCMTLTFDLYVGGGGIHSKFYSLFILL